MSESKLIRIKREVIIEYDPDNQIAYIYLHHPIADGESTLQVGYGGNVVLDVDDESRLLGIELLDAPNSYWKAR